MTTVAILRHPIDVNIRNLAFLQKMNIEITLRDARSSDGAYIHSYSTLDKIEGTVKITPKHDTSFDDLDISFIGFAKTFVDKLASTAAINGRTEATHRFLRLTQPQHEFRIPEPRIFQAGKAYSFPFTFVVPSHLLPRACTHNCANSHVKEAHLLLPPSMGDPELAGYGGRLLDDLAPEMTKIQYAIRVRVTKDRDDGTENLLGEASKKLRIKPAFDEQPPLSVENDSEEYSLRVEKTVRKGLMKGKLGKLVMEASQPKSFRLPAVAPGDAMPPNVSTMVKVHLRFDPQESNSPPPRLGSVTSKLKVTTFYASSPRHTFPTKTSTFLDMSQGYISEYLPLSSLCVAAVEWTRHEPGDSSPPSSPRRDSAVSATSTLSSASTLTLPSSTYRSTHPFYTSSILVPLSLPASKHLVPTFHTCIVSRVYALSLSLSIHGHALGPSIALKLPVQISSEGSVDGVERRRLSEQMEQAVLDAEAVFEPRASGTTLGLGELAREGSRESGNGGMDLPPGYEASHHHGQAANEQAHVHANGHPRTRNGALGDVVAAGVAVFG